MKILVPVDGSAYSLKALEIASDFAKTKQAEIYVISVTPSIGGMEDHEITPHRRERHAETVQKRADEAIETARGILRTQPVGVAIAQTVSTTLSIPDAVIDFAEAEKIDLIVLSSRGLGASSRFRVGSIATQVVKRSPCSVYLVKIPAVQG